jgi:hypothetical protein
MYVYMCVYTQTNKSIDRHESHVSRQDSLGVLGKKAADINVAVGAYVLHFFTHIGTWRAMLHLFCINECLFTERQKSFCK